MLSLELCRCPCDVFLFKQTTYSNTGLATIAVVYCTIRVLYLILGISTVEARSVNVITHTHIHAQGLSKNDTDCRKSVSSLSRLIIYIGFCTSITDTSIIDTPLVLILIVLRGPVRVA